MELRGTVRFRFLHLTNLCIFSFYDTGNTDHSPRVRTAPIYTTSTRPTYPQATYNSGNISAILVLDKLLLLP